MKSPVTNYSVMDATATTLIALIFIKLYNTTELSVTSMMGVYPP